MSYPNANNFINTPREYSPLTRRNINKILRSSTKLSDREKRFIENKLSNLGMPIAIEAILNMGPYHWKNIGISPSVGMSVKNAFIKFQKLSLRKMNRTRDRVLKLVKEKHDSINFINDFKKRIKDRGSNLVPKSYISDKKIDRGPDSYFGEIRAIKKIAATKKKWTLRDVDKLYNLLYKK